MARPDSPLDLERFRETLGAGLEELGLSLDAEAIGILEEHAREIKRWRRRADLTAIDDSRALAIRMYLDALTAATLPAHGARVLDLGSGAGFPGIPLAVARPDLSVLLAERRTAKTAFLHHVLSRWPQLDLRVLSGPAGASAEVEGPVDVVIARAFAAPAETRREAAPWLAAGGRLLILRGPSEEGEPVGPDEPFELEAVHELRLPVEGTPRRILDYRRR